MLNGYALVLNAGMTAALGIVFWMVATRLFTPGQVGLAAALISSMTTISYFAQMNLGSLLTRFLPTAGGGAAAIVLASYGMAGLAAALGALIFAAGVGIVAEPLAIIREDAGMMALFVAATVLWTVFALQDAALAGMRRAALVPLWNTVHAVAKIALLFLLALPMLAAWPGIFLAWIIPILPIVAVVNAAIWRWSGAAGRAGEARGVDLRTARRFWGWDFVGSLALGAAFGLAPVMVTAAAGVEATAAYHLAWSFAYSIYLVGRAMSTSLLAEGAGDPARLRRLIADSLGHALLLILGAVLVVLAFAPLIMGLFGPAYVETGAPLLRVLALSCLPWAVTTIYCAVARVRGRTRSVAVVQITTLVIFAAVSAALVGGQGAQGVAMGWLVAHGSVCAGIVLRVLHAEGRAGLVLWGLSLAGAWLRLARGLPRPARAAGARAGAIPPEVAAGLAGSVLGGLVPAVVKGGLTDVMVLVLRAGDGPEAEARAVLKFSASAEGIAALRRNALTLRELAQEARLGPHAYLLPRLILEADWGRFHATAETVVPGVEGRAALRQGRGAGPALRGAAAVLADMHRRMAVRRRIDEVWAQDWIDGPVAVLARIGGDRGAALARLRAGLREMLVGRVADLGLGHGDAWPGNLFFLGGADGEGPPRLSGLVDWDTCRRDALAGTDACQIALALRMERSGEELGPVVRAALRQATWVGPEEAEILLAAGLWQELGPEGDPALRRAILLLTWLRHVAMVIGQSEAAAARRFWWWMNVDPVLAALEAARDRGARGGKIGGAP